MDPGELTYAEVGWTRGDLPPGFHHLRRRGVLGPGPSRAGQRWVTGRHLRAL